MMHKRAMYIWKDEFDFLINLRVGYPLIRYLSESSACTVQSTAAKTACGLKYEKIIAIIKKKFDI